MAPRSGRTRPVGSASQRGRRETQRERLLAGIVAAVNRDGYARTSVGTVIAEAGVSRPTFYEYFSDLGACFRVAVTEIGERREAEVRKAVEGAPAEHAPQAMTGALVDFAGSAPELARFLDSTLCAGPRALEKRDRGIRELARIVDERRARLAGETRTPDLPIDAMIGGLARLLVSRMRRGIPTTSALRGELIDWVARHERPMREHRWRTLAPPAPAPRSALTPEVRVRPPQALARGRSRLSETQIAENHRLRLLFAAAELAVERGYAATTIAELTARARLDRRAFYAAFKDKHELFMAVHEFGLERLLAATADTYFAGGSWPERAWEAGRGFTGFLQQNPTLAHVIFIESYAVGRDAIQRMDDIANAFTMFFAEGYRYEPKLADPPQGVLEASSRAAFELLYLSTREGPSPRLAGLAPHVTYMVIAPFIGPAAADELIDAKLSGAGEYQRTARD